MQNIEEIKIDLKRKSEELNQLRDSL